MAKQSDLDIELDSESSNGGYLGMEIGGMKVPYVPIVYSKNGFKPQDVSTIFWDFLYELPMELENYRKISASKKEEAAKKAGKIFFDGEQVRAEAVGCSEKGLDLILSRTSFFSKASSNDAVGTRMGDENRTVREIYVDENKIRELTDPLANSVGVQVGIITSDNKIPLMRRSNKIMQYPGLYGIPAGFMDPAKDGAKVEMTHDLYGKIRMRNVVSPYFTMIREVGEEILGKAPKSDKKYNRALESLLENMKIIGVGRAYDDLHVEVLMASEIDAESDYVTECSKFAMDKFEHEGKPIMVDFDITKLFQYMTKRISEKPKGTPDVNGIWIEGSSPEWVPAQWATVYYMLVNRFGSDKVNKGLDLGLSLEGISKTVRSWFK